MATSHSTACSSACPDDGSASAPGSGSALPSRSRYASSWVFASAIWSFTTASRLASRRTCVSAARAAAGSMSSARCCRRFFSVAPSTRRMRCLSRILSYDVTRTPRAAAGFGTRFHRATAMGRRSPENTSARPSSGRPDAITPVTVVPIIKVQQADMSARATSTSTSTWVTRSASYPPTSVGPQRPNRPVAWKAFSASGHRVRRRSDSAAVRSRIGAIRATLARIWSRLGGLSCMPRRGPRAYAYPGGIREPPISFASNHRDRLPGQGHPRPADRLGVLEDSRLDDLVFSGCRHPRSPSTPALPPSLVFGRPQAVARDVALVEAHYLGLHEFDESRLVRR